jgi:hypothetical protein
MSRSSRSEARALDAERGPGKAGAVPLIETIAAIDQRRQAALCTGQTGG